MGLFGLSPLALQGQSTDLRSWIGADYTYKWSKKIDVKLEQQFRFHQDLRALSGSVSEIALKYDLPMAMKLGAGYRFSTSPLEHNHRFNIGMRWKWNFGDVAFTYRLKYQSESAWFRQFDNAFRSKFQFAWHASKKHDPYFFLETFQSQRPEIQGDSKVRWGLGNEFDVGKRKTLNAFVFYQYQLNQPNPERAFVVGLSYSAAKKRKKKKKKE